MNYYSEVIEALMNDNIDWERIGTEVAKRHPKLFLDIIKGCRVYTTFERQCKILALSGGKGKIEAIKLYRNHHGSSLKDAKFDVEALMGEG